MPGMPFRGPRMEADITVSLRIWMNVDVALKGGFNSPIISPWFMLQCPGCAQGFNCSSLL